MYKSDSNSLILINHSSVWILLYSIDLGEGLTTKQNQLAMGFQVKFQDFKISNKISIYH